MPDDPNIAVVAILLKDDLCLFLRRNKTPLNWCPPCGRLKYAENPLDGLKREVLEETGIHVQPLMPVDVWSGTHNHNNIISITYVCIANTDEVILSDEHSDFVWVPIEELQMSKIETDFKIKEWPLLIKIAKTYGIEKGLC